MRALESGKENTMVHLQDTRVPRRQPASRAVCLIHFALKPKEVIVTGDFSGWAREGIRLIFRGYGIWEASLLLAPGEYQYRLLVDGRWQDHPEARKRVPNPFGSQNCVLVVPENGSGSTATGHAPQAFGAMSWREEKKDAGRIFT